MQCSVRSMAEAKRISDTLPKKGKVTEVCKEWLVHEDGALAYALQQQEVERHYHNNKSRNAVLREDFPLALTEQKREYEDALVRYQKEALLQEERDAAVARRLAEEYTSQEELRRARLERDSLLAHQLQEKIQHAGDVNTVGLPLPGPRPPVGFRDGGDRPSEESILARSERHREDWALRRTERVLVTQVPLKSASVRPLPSSSSTPVAAGPSTSPSLTSPLLQHNGAIRDAAGINLPPLPAKGTPRLPVQKSGAMVLRDLPRTSVPSQDPLRLGTPSPESVRLGCSSEMSEPHSRLDGRIGRHHGSSVDSQGLPGVTVDNLEPKKNHCFPGMTQIHRSGGVGLSFASEIHQDCGSAPLRQSTRAPSSDGISDIRSGVTQLRRLESPEKINSSGHQDSKSHDFDNQGVTQSLNRGSSAAAIGVARKKPISSCDAVAGPSNREDEDAISAWPPPPSTQELDKQRQELQDEELARQLQEVLSAEDDQESRDRAVAIEAQDLEIAKMLQDKERARARRARERARAKAQAKKEAEVTSVPTPTSISSVASPVEIESIDPAPATLPTQDGLVAGVGGSLVPNIAAAIDPTFSRPARPSSSGVDLIRASPHTTISVQSNYDEEDTSLPYFPVQGQKRMSSLDKKKKNRSKDTGCKQQ